MCAPVTARRAAPRLTTLPRGRVATALHVGPYETIGLADHAMHSWIQGRGLEPAGPLREVYLDDPALVPADALRTEIVLPVR